MSIEGESMIDSVIVDQSESGAIDKTKVFVVVPRKDRFGGFLDRFSDAENSKTAFVESSHELDRSSMTHPEANDRDGFREDKIGC
jgi:hypothetical protein